MKHLLFLIICGGTLLLCPIYTRVEPYTLSYSLVHPGQLRSKGSRSIKRPLVVDLVGHTLTVPSQVIGYTLTLERGDGEVYTYDRRECQSRPLLSGGDSLQEPSCQQRLH